MSTKLKTTLATKLGVPGEGAGGSSAIFAKIFPQKIFASSRLGAFALNIFLSAAPATSAVKKSRPPPDSAPPHDPSFPLLSSVQPRSRRGKPRRSRRFLPRVCRIFRGDNTPGKLPDHDHGRRKKSSNPWKTRSQKVPMIGTFSRRFFQSLELSGPPPAMITAGAYAGSPFLPAAIRARRSPVNGKTRRRHGKQKSALRRARF